MTRPLRIGVGVAFALAALLAWRAPIDAQAGSTLPTRLTDREFWELTQSLSEPGGTFASDNLVSNETGLQKVLPALADRHPPGGVYIGVGPEQNFTYIAALRPQMAFIVDIRRGNRDLHLMYRALFELARDRAEFVSLLFSRPRPGGLTLESTIQAVFEAFENVPASELLYRANLARVTALLAKTRGWPLSEDDLRGIEYVYGQFFRSGPGISYFSRNSSRGAPPLSTEMSLLLGTFAALMQATDARGERSSFLASEARFAVVKDLETRNLVVPVVGNFAGPAALRGIGDWLRARHAALSVFYLSNVEDYLRRDRSWDTFCLNVVSMPTDSTSDVVWFGAGGRGFAPPQPLEVPGLHGAAPTGFTVSQTTNTVVVRYNDGSSRTMPVDEAIKVLEAVRLPPANRVGSIADATKPCR